MMIMNLYAISLYYLLITFLTSVNASEFTGIIMNRVQRRCICRDTVFFIKDSDVYVYECDRDASLLRWTLNASDSDSTGRFTKIQLSSDPSKCLDFNGEGRLVNCNNDDPSSTMLFSVNISNGSMIETELGCLLALNTRDLQARDCGSHDEQLLWDFIPTSS